MTGGPGSRDGDEIWARLERSMESRRGTTPSGTAVGGEPATPRDGSTNTWPTRTIWRLDILAATIWAYFFVKVFIFDIDRALLLGMGTWAVRLLEYRVIFYLVLVAVVAVAV